MKTGHTLTLMAAGLLGISLLFSPLAYAEEAEGAKEEEAMEEGEKKADGAMKAEEEKKEDGATKEEGEKKE